MLTVVANQSYERYVSGYQAEVAQEWGTTSDAAPVRNARSPRGVARLQKQRVLSSEFQALWERIHPKTRYAVRIDSARLINEVVAALDRVEIRTPQISIQRARVEAAGDEFTALRIAEGRRALEPGGPTPNIVALIAELLEHTTPPLRLTRRTLLEVYRRTRNREAALRAPEEFAATAVRIIRDKLADQLVDGIQYEPVGDEYQMQQWEMEIEAFEHYLLLSPKGVYDQVAVDTLARDPRDSVEGQFLDEMEHDERVRLYVKLPRWFTVPTPLGSYNPDWALVMEERDEFGETRDTLYLVAETKGTTRLEDLPPDQRRKVRCGARHCGSQQLGEPGTLQDVEYRLAASMADLS